MLQWPLQHWPQIKFEVLYHIRILNTSDGYPKNKSKTKIRRLRAIKELDCRFSLFQLWEKVRLTNFLQCRTVIYSGTWWSYPVVFLMALRTPSALLGALRVDRGTGRPGRWHSWIGEVGNGTEQVPSISMGHGMFFKDFYAFSGGCKWANEP